MTDRNESPTDSEIERHVKRPSEKEVRDWRALSFQNCALFQVALCDLALLGLQAPTPTPGEVLPEGWLTAEEVLDMQDGWDGVTTDDYNAGEAKKMLALCRMALAALSTRSVAQSPETLKAALQFGWDAALSGSYCDRFGNPQLGVMVDRLMQPTPPSAQAKGEPDAE